jgi:hypothetical protein
MLAITRKTTSFHSRSAAIRTTREICGPNRMKVYGSLKKDLVENWLHSQICAGLISVTDAQNGIKTDWRYLPQATS